MLTSFTYVRGQSGNKERRSLYQVDSAKELPAQKRGYPAETLL